MVGMVFGACVQKKNQVINVEYKQEVKPQLPLAFAVTFDDYGEKQLGYDEVNGRVDMQLWEEHSHDSIVYFNITLNNQDKRKIVFKTALVATRIPFVLLYKKGDKQCKSTLEVVQQFNTVHKDSLILNICEANETSFIQKAYHVNYAKNVPPDIEELSVKQYNDTIEVVSRF